MATLAHALHTLGFIGPLVIFLIRRQSRFVSFHALQALLWQIAYMVVIFVIMFSVMVAAVFSFAAHSMTQGSPPPLGVFLVIPFVWLALFGGSVINIVLAVVYAIKAGRGEWASYPIFGSWARKILKMPPVAA